MTVTLAPEGLESEALVVLLGQLALVLAAATALGRGARRLGFPPVVGELLTGIVLGPSLFGLVALAVAVAGKFVGATGGALPAGLPTREALGIGAVLDARGAMEVVVATVGLRLGILTDGSYAIVVLMGGTRSAGDEDAAGAAFGGDR